jgi:hypothetical protein
MFSSNNGYSLADIAAVTGGNNNGGFFGNGFGGDGWWIFILFLFAFGGWGNGGWFGNGNNSGVGSAAFQGALTRADLTDEINFSDLDHAVRDTRVDLSNDYHDLSTNVLQGICDLNGTINNVGNSINTNLNNLGYQLQSGINDVNVNGMQNTYALGSQLTALGNQMSSCCCDMRYQVEKGFSDTNYNLATQMNAVRQDICDQTRDIVENQNANTRAILDRLTSDKMADLRDENQALKFAASQAAQNNYLVDQLRPCPIPAYNVPNPYCCNGGCFNNYNY